MSRHTAGAGTLKLRKLHHVLGLALNHLAHARRHTVLKEDPSLHLHHALREVDKYWTLALAATLPRGGKHRAKTSPKLHKAHRQVVAAATKARALIKELKPSLRSPKLNKKERQKRSRAAVLMVAKAIEKTSALTPRLPIEDLLSPITGKGTAIADISFDIYCPKAYKHHTRLTMWMPRIMANGDHVTKALKKGRSMLKACGVRDVNGYVIGLNSRVNQYKEQHLLMLDFDDTTYEELPLAALKKEPGVLLRTASGFHFLGLKLYDYAAWRARLKALRRVAAADHIDLSLQRGYATLRMSASPRKPFAPIVWG